MDHPDKFAWIVNWILVVMLFAGLIVVSSSIEHLGVKQEVWWTESAKDRASLHAQLNDISLLITGHLDDHASDISSLKAMVNEQAQSEALQWQVISTMFFQPVVPERKPKQWAKASAAKP